MNGFLHVLGNQKFHASFFPHEALRHLLEIKLNMKIVSGMCGFCRIFFMKKEKGQI
jgi:hypothetical protein